MQAPKALIFDFDGVLIESEAASNRHLAQLLTNFGRPTSARETLSRFAGLAGADFAAALERHLDGPIPKSFRERRTEEMKRVLAEGIEAVDGAVDFVRSLPPDLPKAVASSSSVQWIETHLQHIGLADSFGSHVYSGAEHVKRGKPAPDLYLHAADALGVAIADCVIIEDSEIGATGAVASGAIVVGLVAASHCLDDHAERLRTIGVHHVAGSFDEIQRIISL